MIRPEFVSAPIERRKLLARRGHANAHVALELIRIEGVQAAGRFETSRSW